jgi:hypothetical protein
MKLINTDGLALIGPGSEWLWSTVGGLVAVVTLLAIYRQLRMQRSARISAEIDSIWREWTSEAMYRRQLVFLVALREDTEPANLPFVAVSYIGPYFGNLGYRVRMGHLDRRFVHSRFGPAIRMWWTWLSPSLAVVRQKYGEPEIGRNFEWLAEHMAELDRKAGATRDYDAAHLAGRIPGLIEDLHEGIRLAEELRTVIVRPGSPTLTPQMARSRPRPSSG